ncbi:hypothetical protein BJV82DRAFT_674521 [Fennellomyces sp. T-0311]|nr:hypothetical protein BJV82DRAFT_674521 [Fennellomyces sp. T-0311]
MDYSQAQRSGFNEAFRQSFPGAALPPAAFLKGCYYHWRNSIEKLRKVEKAIPAEKVTAFLECTDTMYQTLQPAIFDAVTQALREQFPKAEDWLNWWLQPEVASMIFKARTEMHDDLVEHTTRTTNGIEAFHRSLYLVIATGKPIIATLLELLTYIQTFEASVDRFYSGKATSYKRPRPEKQVHQVYQPTKKFVNDGRAPDTVEKLVLRKSKHTQEGNKSKRDTKFQELLSQLSDDDLKTDYQAGNKDCEECTIISEKRKANDSSRKARAERYSSIRDAVHKKAKLHYSQRLVRPALPEGYSVDDVPNSNNACFIDSILQIFLRTILPYLPNEPTRVPNDKRSNMIADLWVAAQNYDFTQGLIKARTSIWENAGQRFDIVKGRQGDPLDVLSYLFGRRKDGELSKHFRFTTIAEALIITPPKIGSGWKQAHLTAAEKPRMTNPIHFITPQEFEEDCLNSRTDGDIASVMVQKISEYRITKTEGQFLGKRIIQYSRYLVIVDRLRAYDCDEERGSIGGQLENTTWYPVTIDLGIKHLREIKYELCGRLCATSPNGIHFKSLCRLPNGSIYQFDGLSKDNKGVFTNKI